MTLESGQQQSQTGAPDHERLSCTLRDHTAALMERTALRRVLMIAYHYPPCHGSSGVHRTLKFSRHLGGHGWAPVVLTAHPRAYPFVSSGQLGEIPRAIHVERAFALDANRHLAIRGRTVKLLTLPDRWATWAIGGVSSGLRLVRRFRPAVIWSTFPIATAHLIGFLLHRLTGLPWIADFRDPMMEDDYPTDPALRRTRRMIEAGAVRDAAFSVFVTRSARDMYLSRHPELSPERCKVIPNGYDEDDFAGLPLARGESIPEGRPVRVVHAGLIALADRDPRPLFRALSRLKRDRRLGPEALRIDLRAPGNEIYYGQLLDELGLRQMVHFLPLLPYRESLRDCGEADGLLLLQGASCNTQIPAKTYEYLRLGRPIFGAVTPAGDTAALLRETGGATIVDPADETALIRDLPRFVDAVRAGIHPTPPRTHAERFERTQLSATLAALLEEAGRHRGQ